MVTIRRILFPSDFSDLALHALTYAKFFAKTYEAELHVIHVVDEASLYWMAMGPNSLPVGPPPDELIQLTQTEMGKFVERHLKDFPTRVVTEVILGRPSRDIVDYASKHAIDLIVIGTHGHSGLSHALLGSVAEKVIRQAPCPVVTIRAPHEKDTKTS